MASDVRPIVRVEDFETNRRLTRLIAESGTLQNMAPSRFATQAETILARHSERLYVQAVGDALAVRLRRSSELVDDPALDRMYMNLPLSAGHKETHKEMQRRQWFSELQRGITTTAQRRYRPLLSALGTIVAINEPEAARRWSMEIAQRIDAWEDYERRVLGRDQTAQRRRA